MLLYGLWQANQSTYQTPEKNYYEAGYQNSQAIRSIKDIISTLENQRALTALESVLIQVTCLEQLDLHPIILFEEHRIFLGCWLIPQAIDDRFIEDINIIQTGIAQKNLHSTRHLCE